MTGPLRVDLYRMRRQLERTRPVVKRRCVRCGTATVYSKQYREWFCGTCATEIEAVMTVEELHTNPPLRELDPQLRAVLSAVPVGDRGETA